MATTIYASFKDAALAEKAVGALLDNHVKADDISVVRSTDYSQTGDSVAPVLDNGHRSKDNDIEGAAKGGISTTTGADAGAGAIKGVGWGAGLGVMAAIASLAIPGVGIVIGGGVLAAALGGVAASAGAGAAAGWVTGYLKDQGMEEPIAQDFEQNLKNGGALVGVTNTSEKVDDATVRSVLEKYGATGSDLYSPAYLA